MNYLETIICECVIAGEAKQSCKRCRGMGQRPMNGVGHLWADGKWRKDKPPSEIPMVVKYNEASVEAIGSLKSVRQMPSPISNAWAPSPRTILRAQALDFAIRSASLMGTKIISGASLLLEAEYIESWIAGAGKDDSNGT